MILLPSVLSLFLFFIYKEGGWLRDTDVFVPSSFVQLLSQKSNFSKIQIYRLNTPCKSSKDDQILVLYRYFDLHKPNQADRNCFSPA